MVQAGKETFQIRLIHPVNASLLDNARQGYQGIVGTALGSTTKRALVEILFVNRFQNLADRSLKRSINHSRDRGFKMRLVQLALGLYIVYSR